MAPANRSWRTTLARRALFQVHLWLGIVVGLYISLVSVTGAALVFRIDLQRAVHSDLLLPRAPGINVEVPEVLRQLEAFYPRSRILGVDAPTTSRPVYLAYVSDPASFRTVLIDPSDGRVLGELPEHSPIQALQELHFNLQVLLTTSRPTPADTRKFETLYVDQYTGSLLEPNGAMEPGAGDKVLEWVGPLHVGSFGGPGVKILWTILGLAPPLLFVTAFITWWRRVGGRGYGEIELVGGRRSTGARHLGAGPYTPQERDAR